MNDKRINNKDKKAEAEIKKPIKGKKIKSRDFPGDVKAEALDKLIEGDKWLKEAGKLSLDDLSYCFMRSEGGENYSFFQCRVMKEFFENENNPEKTDKHFVEIYTTLLQRIKSTAEKGGVEKLKALILVATRTIIYDISRLPKNSYFIKEKDVPKVLKNDEMHTLIYKEFFWDLRDPSVIFSQHKHFGCLRNVNYEDFVQGIKSVWELLKDNNRKKLVEHWRLMVLEKRLPLKVIQERFSGIVDDVLAYFFKNKDGRLSPEDVFFAGHVEEMLFEIFNNVPAIVRHIMNNKLQGGVSKVEKAILDNPDMLMGIIVMLIENYDISESAKERLAKIKFRLTKKQYDIARGIIKDIILKHLSIEEIREYLILKGDI